MKNTQNSAQLEATFTTSLSPSTLLSSPLHPPRHHSSLLPNWWGLPFNLRALNIYRLEFHLQSFNSTSNQNQTPKSPSIRSHHLLPNLNYKLISLINISNFLNHVGYGLSLHKQSLTFHLSSLNPILILFNTVRFSMIWPRVTYKYFPFF